MLYYQSAAGQEKEGIMRTEAKEKAPAFLFEGLIARQHSLWTMGGIGLVLSLLPMGVAYLAGLGGEFFTTHVWRLSLMPPAVIVYILVAAPILAGMQVRVIEALPRDYGCGTGCLGAHV
jgi:hypothetical protein